MFLKVLKSKGSTRLYFYESYYERDPKTNESKIKQRMIENLGRLDELEKQYDDPIAHFKQLAVVRTAEEKKKNNVTIEIDMDEMMDPDEDNIRNVGYGVLKKLYKDLQLDIYWNRRTHNSNARYSVDQIFRLLVFGRALYPASKKKTFETRTRFFEGFSELKLDDVYHALDVIADNQESLQEWAYEYSNKICKRDMSVAYFDCTNYYFDIGHPDLDIINEDGEIVDKNGNRTHAKYRKRGPEKNHRPDPIIGMGLMMDKNGIPIAYDLFPGNESEKLHMRPIVNRIKSEFSASRTIFVADRGLNTSDNIYWLNGDNKGAVNPRDGYVYGQSVRGAGDDFKKWVLSGDYNEEIVEDPDGNKTKFKHKSRIEPKKLQVNVTKPGSKKPAKKEVTVDQKQMVYYSEKYARKQRIDREIMVARAKDLIAHPKKYDRVTAAGSASYVKNIAFDKKTGEIIDSKSLFLDEEKVAEEEKYDGYYSIVTSELNMSDLEMRNIYRGLIEIENTFKITKSEFEARPVYLWTTKHIDAHFATCFMALLLIRLLQTKLGRRYPVEKILNSLRSYSCSQIDVNRYQFLYYDDVIRACEEAFDMQLGKKYRTLNEIRRLLQY